MKPRTLSHTNSMLSSVSVSSNIQSCNTDHGEALSESLIVQKVLLVLGGYDGSPLFIRSLSAIPVSSLCSVFGILSAHDGVNIAHLSGAAVSGSLRDFSRYGSCSLALRLFLRIASESTCALDTFELNGFVAPSLYFLIKDNILSDSLVSGRYKCSWSPSAQGLLDGLNVLWDDWSLVLSAFHRSYVSSLHREFCGVEAIPVQCTSAISILERRRKLRERTSPLFRLYMDRLAGHNVVSTTGNIDKYDSSVSEFKVTLLNLEPCLRPFLLIIEEVVCMLDLLLKYMHRYSLSSDSLCRVATMLLMLNLRSSENRKDVLLSDVWKFLLHHTLPTLHHSLSFGDPESSSRGDVSWTYFGGPFDALLRVRASVEEVYLKGIFSGADTAANVTIEWRPAILDDSSDTEQLVLRSLNDVISDSVQGTLRILRNVLEYGHHLTSYLSFLSGLCHMRYGDCLDQVFALLILEPVPLNYEVRLRSLLHDAILGWQRCTGSIGGSILSNYEVSCMIHSFEYRVEEGVLSPTVELKPLTDRLGPLSSVFNDAVMPKYSSILCHLLNFQLLYRDVKRLLQLTFRSRGTFCGFFLPRASLLLIQVCFALDRYYRWTVDFSWSSLLSQLSTCKSMSDMLYVHEGYVNFVFECLLVPLYKGFGSSTSVVNPLFSESLFLIHRCASELLRLCCSGVDISLTEFDSVYLVLQSEISTLRSTLNVVCSLSLPDVPTFDLVEDRILSSVVRAGIDLNSSVCHALSLLQRLLR